MQKKILLVSSNRLGDCILYSGLIDYYKNTLKDTNLTMICGPVPGELFRYSDKIDKLIIIKKKKFSMHWLNVWLKTCLIYWDEVVDCRGTLLSFFLLTKKRFNHTKKKKREHIVHEISEAFGKKLLHPYVSLDKKKTNKSVLESVKKKKLINQFIMISPSANWIGKIWPQENFVNLMSKLENCKLWQNPIFIIVGKKNESVISDNFINNDKKKLNLVGKANLAEIYLIMKECDLFIGNDSGLMHLAAAAGIPTVGLFGPSDFKRYGPWGGKTLSILSQNTPEELMGKTNFDPKNTETLMRSLSVEKVFKETVNFYESLK